MAPPRRPSDPAASRRAVPAPPRPSCAGGTPRRGSACSRRRTRRRRRAPPACGRRASSAPRSAPGVIYSGAWVVDSVPASSATHLLDSVLVLTRRLQQCGGKARQSGDLRSEMLQHRGTRGAGRALAQPLAQRAWVRANGHGLGRAWCCSLGYMGLQPGERRVAGAVAGAVVAARKAHGSPGRSRGTWPRRRCGAGGAAPPVTV